MSEFVGVTAAGLAGGDKEDWTDAEQEECGAVEGFEEWGAMALPTKDANTNGRISTKGESGVSTASDELRLVGADRDKPSHADDNEDAKNSTGGDNWSWGAAWSAFTTAVQQVRAGHVPRCYVHAGPCLSPRYPPALQSSNAQILNG
jgi:hypothetical protein